MNKYFLPLSLLAAVISTTISAEAPNQSPPDPFTQAQPAIEARVGVHRLMAANLMDVGALAMGQKKWNGFRMNDRTDAIEALSKMYFEFFMVAGSYAGSKAKASIQDNAEDFKKMAMRLETATVGLAHASRTHNPAGSGKAVVSIINACNSCHEKYMEPALLLPVPPPPSH